MIHPERIQILAGKTSLEKLTKTASAGDGSFVVYWMQASQRTTCNHALEYAIRQANALQKPLVVYFGLTDGFPEANLRHYRFLLEGLLDVKQDLESKGIQLLLLHNSPEEGAILLSKSAALLVTDAGYLRIERAWRRTVAAQAHCPVIQVETNVIVPVATASPKEEYSAATLRSKLQKILSYYLEPLEEGRCQISSLGLDLTPSLMHGSGAPGETHPPAVLSLEDLDATLGQLRIDGSVKPVTGFLGGSREAERRLDAFLADRLSGYGEGRNTPGGDGTSQLSPYLHFGQISPLEIALRVIGAGIGPHRHSARDQEAFLEELIVRRELSMNYVYYNPEYDRYHSLPAWAQATLTKHLEDPRPWMYTAEELENAKTHDPYWNAAQLEMKRTGKMDGYMRMYWGKKILEWSRTPEEGFAIALAMNNKYSLDGRDPNGFAGIAWCFGKHDRPWTERSIFGNVRYMNDKGLERKFKMKSYLDKIQALELGS